MSACAPGARPTPVSRTAAVPVANPDFDAWVASFRTRAAQRGIAQPILSGAFQDAGYLPLVIERDRNQTEFTRNLEDYLAIAASDERIEKGQAGLRRERRTLDAIAAQYGVEPHVVTAVWGLESRYGERRGDIPVISALSTLAYDGRRGAFFEQQLIAALKILQEGDTVPARMTGSWAGAMGHTQFIPTSYLAYAVDFTGDGRRDIWSEDPTDSLASTAAYLQRSGWRSGQPWGLEARLPQGFNMRATGRSGARSVASWSALGVTDARGETLPDYGQTAILAPEGAVGPAFAVYHNFGVILRYNNAEKYGLGVGYLSDRLIGRPPLVAGFPPDARGLTLEDRKNIQTRLTARGFDTQGSDGVIGPNTTDAIRAFQRSAGLPVDGQASAELLAQLQ
ncbi:MAG: lytic murein transglycosylase [Pseudomonadota bacterium]